MRNTYYKGGGVVKIRNCNIKLCGEFYSSGKREIIVF